MPNVSAAGPVKSDQRRVVGIFYLAWHSDGLAILNVALDQRTQQLLTAIIGYWIGSFS